MTEALLDQNALASMIMDYQRVMLKTPKEKRTVGWFKTQLEGLNELWTEFVAAHRKILRLQNDDEYKVDSYFTEDKFATTSTQFNLTKSLLLTCIHPGRNQSSIAADEAYADVRIDAPAYKNPLPPIQLPEFSGKQLEWETFKGMFVALVHDVPSIPPILKLQYLIRSLSGEAANRFKNIQVTADNYNGTWQAILDRYDNKKLLVASHMSNVISCPSISKRSVEELNRILDVVRETKQAIDNLNINPAILGEMWLIHHIVHKLDNATRLDWEREADKIEEYPTYRNLFEFLERSIRVLDAARFSTVTLNSNSKHTKGNPTINSKQTTAHMTPTNSDKASRSCINCQGDHYLYACKKYKSMTHNQRLDVCKKHKLCLNCLNKSHFLKDCPSQKKCSVCDGKHHTTLHRDSSDSTLTSESQKKSSQEAQSSSVPDDASSTHFTSQVALNNAVVTRTVLLATAQIILADNLGNEIFVRALIDPGAQRSFVTQRILNLLSPEERKLSISITGVGGTVTSIARKEVHLHLKSTIDKQFLATFSALVLDELTQMLPKVEVIPRKWAHLHNLCLADPSCLKPNKVDCLLGADLYPLIMLDGLVKGDVDDPIAQRTVFGWILTGNTFNACASANNLAVQVFHTHTEPDLTKLLEKFWEVEDLPKPKPLSPEDQYCESYFLKTTRRDSSGRFIVRLPFSKQPRFESSRDIAVACFFRLEKRFKRNPALADRYAAFIEEYLDLNHMEIVPKSMLSSEAYYLPHHAVFRPENPDKIRVVFNASQQASNKISLNDTLLSGPKLQKDITVILTRWRFSKFVFVADIVKMFRQILVDSKDIDWQRIVWRPNESEPIKDYRALTVTYGTAPAPFLALRVLQQLAQEGQEAYPEAASLLRHQVFVDDIFGGGDDLDIAIQRRDQLINLLASAGMTLGKWSANTIDLLDGVAAGDASDYTVKLEDVVSTLGLKWRPRADCFVFASSLNSSPTCITKRNILSDFAKLFDPLGWLSPVLVTAKIILQDLWLSKLDWDTPIQGELCQRWLDFRSSLTDIQLITMDRWVGGVENDSWQLHGFADASKRAYTAALYAVIPGRSSKLLMAKTKIAPTKVDTLPRLELRGATLLVKIAQHLLPQLHRPADEIHFWSDSKVVLDWLKAHPSKWPTFIANRVSEITSAFPQATWRHVPTTQNAVDCATRGLSPRQLSETELWWAGPQWLLHPQSQWPSTSEEETQISSAQEDTRLPDDADTHCLNRIRCISRFSRICRVLSFCARWRFNTVKNAAERNADKLTVTELRWGRIFCFRLIQLHHFQREIEDLKAGRLTHIASSLSRLSPLLDEHGLVRVGGRLEYAPLPYSERHPIILPGNEPITKRIIEEAHLLTMHGGPQLMLSHLRRTLWITRAASVVKGIYHKCVMCTRANARIEQQQMAKLPSARVSPQRPFATTGLDYAGPIPILFSKGCGAKTTKGYIVIFICFVVKAVHIEVASDMTTDAFLAAYSRFAARRGVCHTLYSDNATTFRGASAELNKMFSESASFARELTGKLADRGTTWLFIPPRAPHFGGLWEAAVKSFKYHFRRVVGDATLTFEELSTLAAKIEACLNSRPLCPLTSQSREPAALTPGHFLIGSSCLSPPEPYDPTPMRLTNRWCQLGQMRNSFWQRWRKEVLHHLQRRNKWLKPHPNLQVGDLIILMDESSPPTKWPLAIVTEVHPGKDGLVRTVTVRTASTVFTRPVIKFVRFFAARQQGGRLCLVVHAFRGDSYHLRLTRAAGRSRVLLFWKILAFGDVSPTTLPSCGAR